MVEMWMAVAAGIVSACMVVMTVLCVMMAQDIRRAMRRATTAFARCDRMIRETQRLVGHADQTARQIEGIVHRACQTASGVMDRVESWPEAAQTWWVRSFGTRARSGPRRNGHG